MKKRCDQVILTYNMTSTESETSLIDFWYVGQKIPFTAYKYYYTSWGKLVRKQKMGNQLKHVIFNPLPCDTDF